MAEQWIDAATAQSVLSGAAPSLDAARALCIRAHSGLITARAKLFILGERRKGDVSVPALFWWARGEAALHQNWTSGDFSTWIEEEFECQALGVTFPLSGITDMLPVERRAEVARSLSVAGNPEWVSAAEAVQLACQRPGITNGRALIVEHGRLGLLTGRAVLAQGFTGPDLETCTWETREWQMPTTFWDCVEQATDRFQEWDLSRLSAGAAINGKPEWLRASGVHILAGPLREPVAASPAQALSGAATTKGGGRPPQPWWDDLWCAVWGLINVTVRAACSAGGWLR